MEENNEKSLWDKSVEELTVKETLVLNLALPAVMIGGVLVGAVAFDQAGKAKTKLKQKLAARKNKNNQEEE